MSLVLQKCIAIKFDTVLKNIQICIPFLSIFLSNIVCWHHVERHYYYYHDYYYIININCFHINKYLALADRAARTVQANLIHKIYI